MAGKTITISGTAYLQELDDSFQPVGGIIEPGQVYPWTITVEKTTTEMANGKRGMLGTTARAKSRISSVSSTATFHELVVSIAKMLTASEYVEKEAVTETGVTKTATFAADGGWLDLGAQGIKNVKVGGTAIDFAEYDINPRLGFIRVKPSAASYDTLLADEKEFTFDVDRVAYGQLQVGKSSTSRYRVWIDGINEETGDDVDVLIPSGVFAPTGEFSIISTPDEDTYPEWAATVALETVPGYDSVAFINGLSLDKFADA